MKKLDLQLKNCEAVNPVKEYFLSLPKWQMSEKSHIKELADTIKCRIGSDRWEESLRRWLVGCVSNVFEEDRCTNQVMLVLTGAQGSYKTTWLEHLCPLELRYFHLYSGKWFDPTDKEADMLISDCFIINIEDLGQRNRKYEEELRNMITKSRVKYRRPYDIQIREYPHMASFCGSVNGNDFLPDPSGSRCYLLFEAEEIDIGRATRLNMDYVWSEAYSLWKAG